MFRQNLFFNDFFRNQEKLMNQFEREFKSDFRQSFKDFDELDPFDFGYERLLPGMRHTFNLVPSKRWFDDDFFLLTSKLKPLSSE